ncbi:hypothetical protein KCX82_15480 [Clostridiales bacterium BAD-6]|uniref:Uncharacterized protein n=1 Tax=Sinanaerobacter chloroacetimidivorans TaxID=2818044 RepID=A0A8J8B2G9_9FIRM|nr:hypothetical protein [Sinanaerobacter chloroacetimidivorans]
MVLRNTDRRISICDARIQTESSMIFACIKETIINVKQLNISVIKEPDAKTQSR